MQNRPRKHREVYRDAARQTFGDGGFSMIATALALLATAVLTALLLGTMLNSDGASGSGVSDEPGVAQATALQAQQTLSTGLTAADAAAVNAGGYGSLQPLTLTASNPSIIFVNGPSTNSDTVSMAVVSGNDSQSDAGTGDGAGMGGDAGGFESGGDGGGGSITLADRSTNGTCWLVWKSTGGDTWYGAETGQASCIAQPIASTPSPAPVSSSSIGWQSSSFPYA